MKESKARLKDLKVKYIVIVKVGKKLIRNHFFLRSGWATAFVKQGGKASLASELLRVVRMKEPMVSKTSLSNSAGRTMGRWNLSCPFP